MNKSIFANMYNKNFSKEPTEKQVIGEMGENYACEYLKSIGFMVVERNYLKKWGEIDIIASKKNILHFIEVKSVTRDLVGVTHVTNSYTVNLLNRILKLLWVPVEPNGVVTSVGDDSFRAEDNMHPWKLERLGRAVQSYLLDRKIDDETEWQFDLITVQIDISKGLHRIEVLEDIVL